MSSQYTLFDQEDIRDVLDHIRVNPRLHPLFDKISYLYSQFADDFETDHNNRDAGLFMNSISLHYSYINREDGKLRRINFNISGVDDYTSRIVLFVIFVENDVMQHTGKIHFDHLTVDLIRAARKHLGRAVKEEQC